MGFIPFIIGDRGYESWSFIMTDFSLIPSKLHPSDQFALRRVARASHDLARITFPPSEEIKITEITVTSYHLYKLTSPLQSTAMARLPRITVQCCRSVRASTDSWASLSVVTR